MKGDFTGFSFDGIHCSELGIIHVASSDRYDEELFSEIRDKTIEIPNNHGDYYYGSTYGPRTFEIEFAFDSITEKQFRNIRRLFGTSKICELIFDERPYKVYYAKLESPIEMSYVCFDEKEWLWETENHNNYIPNSIDHKVYTGNIKRIYKGEGKISLICYYPFAHQLFKTLDLYETNIYNGNVATIYSNVNEWKDSSGLLTEVEKAAYHIDEVIPAGDPYSFAIPVYNPGDLNTGFYLYIPFVNDEILPKNENSDIIINGDTDILLLRAIEKKASRKGLEDTGILINTNNHLIEGVNFSPIANLSNNRKPAWQITGNIYNEYIVGGNFPSIKRKDWRDNQDGNQIIYISCAPEHSGISIHYDYLYF